METGKQAFRFRFECFYLVLLTCGALASHVLAQSNPPSFDGSRTYLALGGETNGVTAVVTGDFNGDGKPDLAAATPDTNGVSVFLNNGDGTFSKPVRYPAGQLPHYVAVADFNGDGRLDLVTANTAGAGSVSVLLGNGNGTFQAPLDSPAGVSTTALAVGDLNHDGKPDLVVANDTSAHPSALFVLLGNGNGTFQTPTRVTIPDYQYFVVTADFDRDGNLDLVCGNGTELWILLGNGNGTFQAPVIIPNAGGGSPYGNSVAVGDFNGDGKLDLAVGDSTQEVSTNIPGTVNILLGNGNGTFQPPLPFQTGTYPYSVAAADFNGDGKLDVAVANARDADVSILFGNGDGTFQVATNYPVGANWTSTVVVGDFNGDGSADVAVSSAFTDTVSILLNKGSGQFHDVASYGVGDQPDAVFASQPYAITAADFNHDGKLDIAVPNSGTKDVSVILGNGNGSFGPPVNYTVGTLPTFIGSADFNGDGHPDLAVVNHQDSNISILLNNGDGTFQTAVNYPAGGANPVEVVIADLNGDGKLDLVTGSLGAGNANQVSVLLGNGDGTFRSPVNSTVPGSGVDGVAVGDFNGDGKPDLAVSNYNSSNVVIMLGNGDGSFQPGSISLGAFGPVAVAVGDFNGDGKADLAVGNFFTSKISVFTGHGDGTFQASATSYNVGNDPHGIVVADFNGDSKPDLALVNVNDHYISIVEGKGDGSFQEAINYGTGKGPAAIAVGDFNNDGKPDLATPSFWFDKVSVLLNNTPAVQPLSAVSRKTHGSAGTFDVNLPLTGTPGIECRSGGAGGGHQIVISFPWAVTFSNAAVTNGAGTVSSASGSGTNKVTVNLTGVANAQTITVTLFNVSDGPNTVDVAVRMSVLLGDVNASGIVTSGDTNLCKAQALQAVTSANFRNDINASGAITTGDVNIIKENALSQLPTSP